MGLGCVSNLNRSFAFVLFSSLIKKKHWYDREMSRKLECWSDNRANVVNKRQWRIQLVRQGHVFHVGPISFIFMQFSVKILPNNGLVRPLGCHPFRKFWIRHCEKPVLKLWSYFFIHSLYRMWDVDKEENFVLNLEGQSGYSRDELITCIAYSSNKGEQ